MALKFDPYQFPTAPAYVKPKNVAEAFAESAPLYEKAIKGVEEYQARQERQKLFNDAMAGDKKGYEWYDSEDPAHKALVEQYIRTGDASGIANQRNNWQLSQERIKEKADAQLKEEAQKQALAIAQAKEKAQNDANEMSEAKAEADFLDDINYKPEFTNDEERAAWDEDMRRKHGNRYRNWLAKENETAKLMAGAQSGKNDAEKATAEEKRDAYIRNKNAAKKEAKAEVQNLSPFQIEQIKANGGIYEKKIGKDTFKFSIGELL